MVILLETLSKCNDWFVIFIFLIILYVGLYRYILWVICVRFYDDDNDDDNDDDDINNKNSAYV